MTGQTQGQLPSTSSQKTEAEANIGFYRKQLEAFVTLSTDLLFGGASEGGKSILVKLASFLWCSQVPGLEIYIFRKFYKDVIKNHMRGELNYHVIGKPWVNRKLVEITENEVRFKNGSLISLGQLRTKEDFEKAQGIAKHVLIIDEATQCKKEHILGLMGWVRMSNDMRENLPKYLRPLMEMCAEIFREKIAAGEWPDVYPPDFPNCYTDEQLKEFFPRTILTANPIGQSVGYFRRSYVMSQTPGHIWRAPDEEGGFMRQFIPSLVTDNPGADKEAQRRRLSAMGSKVSNALIYGDWSAPGGDYFPEWDDALHVVEDFMPPVEWFKFRVLDTGYAEPFHCGWYCVSSGDEFTDREGRTRWFPRGALIKYREWHGCDKDDPSKGVRMRNADIAAGIVGRTPETTPSGSWITLTDSLPFQDRGMGERDTVRKIATEFKEAGVPLRKANTARVTGWSLMRDRLQGEEVAEGVRLPTFYVTRCCEHTIEYIPTLTYHESKVEDATEDGEATHSCDCDRYACAAFPPTQGKKPTTEKELLQEAESNIMTFAGARKAATDKKKRKRRG